MTRFQSTAATAVLFVLCGVAISPLVAAPATDRGAGAEHVSIAISSGSHLTLATTADAARVAGDGKRLTCEHVFRLQVADLGINCSPTPDGRSAARVVQLSD